MMTHVVLTLIGPDRPGLVSALSEKAAACGANWLESRLASYSGRFAGAVHLHVPAEKADALIAALRETESSGLRLVIERADAGPAGGRAVGLELVGQDRPGIVRDVSRVLAARKVSIDSLDTEYVSGSWSGENLFRAHARLRIPAGMPDAELRGALEAIADELMVDISLHELAEG